MTGKKHEVQTTMRIWPAGFAAGLNHETKRKLSFSVGLQEMSITGLNMKNESDSVS